MIANKTLIAAVLATAFAALLSGCAPVIVGAGATAGVAVAQERSVGAAVDDTAIQLRVNQRLLERSERLFTNVDTEVLEGRVLLTGKVPQPDDAVEAVRLTWQVNGVREVLNELQVTDKSSLADYAADAWITTKLRARMLQDRFISDINFTVETVNGTIYLMGIARDQMELERVTNLARSISGVKKVVSHVQLKNDPKRSG